MQQRLHDIAYAQGDFYLALEHWRQYLNPSESPQPINGWDAFQLGELQYQVGDFAGARTAFEHATPLPWRDYRLPYYKGLCHLRDGSTQAARVCFAETVNLLNPDIIALRLNELHRATSTAPDYIPVPDSVSSLEQQQVPAAKPPHA